MGSYKRRKASRLIEIANDKVGFAFACEMIGTYVPPIYGNYKKINCPFGQWYHSDGGKDKTFAVYPASESAWCWACNVLYTPVKLISIAWDMPAEEAAWELLNRAGIKPPSLEDIWVELERSREPIPDRASLGQALRLYLGRTVPDWNSRQFDPDVAGLLDKCLGLLDSVNTEQEARQWLDGTKDILTHKLGLEGQ
jgi:hypothetical protein